MTPSVPNETQQPATRPGGLAGGVWKSGWDLIDDLAQRDVPDKVELRFKEDGNVDFGWYHPCMAPTMCALCGKGCRERGEEPCANLFPFCG